MASKPWGHSISYKTKYLPVQNLFFQVNNRNPRMKMFSWECNHHVHCKGSAKKLWSTCDIK